MDAPPEPRVEHLRDQWGCRGTHACPVAEFTKLKFYTG